SGGEGLGGEGAVEDVDPVLGPVGGVEEAIARGVGRDGQAGVDGSRGRRLDHGRRSDTAVPGGDGAVEVGEDEGGRRAVEQERRGVVVYLAGRPLRSGRRLRDGDRQADLADARGCYRIEGTDAGPLVGDPEGAPGALRNAP